MRRFFLGDEELTSCGTSQGTGGWKFFCTTCGETWGTISGVERQGWFPVSEHCPRHSTQYRPGGSFLRALVWWDALNGASMEKQLNSCDEKLLRHEGLTAALWIKAQKCPSS